jgi:iron complex outermembrane receptor protein
MIRVLILFTCITFAISAVAQQENRPTDSTRVLQEVTIQAYQYDRSLAEVPASIGILSAKDLDRFSTTSLLPGLNTVPGVRMEERSPGSYRLAIRGSSLRSPFGVRNVKVYWNGLPFTDAGGNTYLNLFDLSSFQEAEVIKGPGSSVYGASTGGVLLLKNTAVTSSGVEATALAGSYGLRHYGLQGKVHGEQSNIRVLYAHQEADGYRRQTGMMRDVVQTQGDFFVNDKGTLSTNILYSDIMYQTPGGLTQQQYEADPQQARPSAGPNASAAEQHAAIYNKTFYTAVHYDYRWNDRWTTRTGVYGSFSQVKNPAIRNYERRTEPGFGGRVSTSYNFTKGRITAGGEFQHSFSPVKVYGNRLGVVDTLQTDDEITINTYFGFAQTEFFLPADFFLTIGASLNKLNVSFIRLSETPAFAADRNFDLVFTPRIALLKKMSDNLSLFASYSQGYSPPTVQELYPSAGFFDQNLKPERGNNLEVGFRGKALSNTFVFDVALYNFQLDETIVIRHTDDGAEYFANAGKTAQQGAEIQLLWSPNLPERSAVSRFKIWTSYTLNHYQFKDYIKDKVSLDGNDLTGVAPTILVGGLDLAARVGLYTNITATYTDRIALNDANTAYASGYTLVGARLGYRKAWDRISIDIFGGVDNALDERYSLGNDLNALANRYYNPAPGINYYSGARVGLTLD